MAQIKLSILSFLIGVIIYPIVYVPFHEFHDHTRVHVLCCEHQHEHHQNDAAESFKLPTVVCEICEYDFAVYNLNDAGLVAEVEFVFATLSFNAINFGYVSDLKLTRTPRAPPAFLTISMG